MHLEVARSALTQPSTGISGAKGATRLLHGCWLSLVYKDTKETQPLAGQRQVSKLMAAGKNESASLLDSKEILH